MTTFVSSHFPFQRSAQIIKALLPSGISHTTIHRLVGKLTAPYIKAEERKKKEVFTAGRIADGRSLAAALVLGADGVMMATRFVATRECLVHQKVKEEIVRKKEFETTLINKSIRLQMRTWKNEAARKVLEIEARKGTMDEIFSVIAGDRAYKLLEQGDVESAPFAVGQSIGLINDILSCKEVVERMVRDSEETLVNTTKQAKA